MTRGPLATRRALSGALFFALAPRAASAGGTRDMLRSLFSHLPSAHAIGAAYLRSCQANTVNAEKLAASLPAAASVADLRSAIAAWVRRDFANARVVMVDGWMLSITEARVCALAYLVT
jgi:hypothetical protein